MSERGGEGVRRILSILCGSSSASRIDVSCHGQSVSMGLCVGERYAIIAVSTSRSVSSCDILRATFGVVRVSRLVDLVRFGPMYKIECWSVGGGIHKPGRSSAICDMDVGHIAECAWDY